MEGKEVDLKKHEFGNRKSALLKLILVFFYFIKTPMQEKQ